MMDKETAMLMDIIKNGKQDCQLTAFILLLEKAENEVEWSYDIWDSLRDSLTSSDSYKRAAASQMLAYLSISDPDQKILQDFPHIWKETYHSNQVVAESVLEATWRIGLAGEIQRATLLRTYEERLSEDRYLKNKDAWATKIIIKNLELLSEHVKEKPIQVLLKKVSE
ncbi:hypothetical protein [Marinilactibacillus kalidii]|uniref:hypothetical protein n=1 Tax=Marinilactibacillus kalidii TaxID=2820274 RepID=UPI001ABE2A6E|nr:hypothetical protein [Marinilactibacillus kalidii]